MEQVFEGMTTVLRAMLGLVFIAGPGVLFWMIVVGVAMGVRWVAHRGPFQRVSRESQVTSTPSTVKS